MAAADRPQTMFRHFCNALTGESAKPTIVAQPRVALYDKEVKISLHNFPKNEKITLYGEYVQGLAKRVIFASCGHYVTDDCGQIDVSQQPSTGGTYTGLEPMGILWSLQPAPGYSQFTRMAINDTDKPRVIHLLAYQGHLELERDIYCSSSDHQHASVARLPLERWLRCPGVTRTEVHAGTVRGILYLPAGGGPFQGVIDMFGLSGGAIEYRASLLASHGFATLCLPYFRYKDLTKHISAVTFDYFQSAVEWLACHPQVSPHGLGAVGLSKGAEFAYVMAAYSPQVKCVVVMNGYPFYTSHDLYYKGSLLCKGSVYDASKGYVSEEGITLRHCLSYQDNIIPSWQGDTKHLILVAEDDSLVNPDLHKYLVKYCPEEKRSNFEIVKYPGAGHLLEPPYTAFCRSTDNPSYNVLAVFGGQRKAHAYAQTDSWQRILRHLRKNIPRTP